MGDKWVVNRDFPKGHIVAMTAAEQDRDDAAKAAAAAAIATAAAAAANQATVRSLLSSRLAKIRTARTAIAAGNLFTSLSANEKAVIDGLLEDDLYLSRISLSLFDGTA